MDAFHACGVEPSRTELSGVLQLVPVADRAGRSLQLLDSMGVSLDSADELIAHWRRTSMQARPDNYRHVPFQTFFRARLLAYVVPFAAFGDAIKNAVPPNYSPVERSYYHIVKWSLATTTAVVMLILMSALALCASNAAVSHSVSEIASIILIVIGSVLAPQAAREAGFASTTGVALQHEAARALSRLRAAEFELTCGEVISGFSSLIRATHSCANVPLPLARQFLFENTKLSPLAYSQKQSSEESQTRRRVSLAADELSALIAADVEHDADDHGARTSDKYEVYSCAPDRFFPWANALVMASAPTVTRVLQGEVSMFDSDSTVIDTLVGLLVVIGLLLSCCFSTLVVLKGAVDEMQCLDGWCKFTVGSITKGFMKNHKTSDNGGFHLRLDTMDAVRSFGSLHSAVKSTAMYVSTCTSILTHYPNHASLTR